MSHEWWLYDHLKRQMCSLSILGSKIKWICKNFHYPWHFVLMYDNIKLNSVQIPRKTKVIEYTLSLMSQCNNGIGRIPICTSKFPDGLLCLYYLLVVFEKKKFFVAGTEIMMLYLFTTQYQQSFSLSTSKRSFFLLSSFFSSTFDSNGILSANCD